MHVCVSHGRETEGAPGDRWAPTWNNRTGHRKSRAPTSCEAGGNNGHCRTHRYAVTSPPVASRRRQTLIIHLFRQPRWRKIDEALAPRHQKKVCERERQRERQRETERKRERERKKREKQRRKTKTTTSRRKAKKKEKQKTVVSLSQKNTQLFPGSAPHYQMPTECSRCSVLICGDFPCGCVPPLGL